jgi:hypothetical protein
MDSPAENELERREKKENMREQLRNKVLVAIDEIDKGFRKAMLMYTIAFYFGLFLIVFSMIATLFEQDGEQNNLLFFGGAGMIDIVAFFVFKPTKDLQQSRANLAQLVAAFISWYVNIQNWDAATKKEVDTKNKTDISALEKISKRNLIDTISILLTMHNIFEDRKKGDEINKTISELKAVLDAA